jgi:hypothetical protein
MFTVFRNVSIIQLAVNKMHCVREMLTVVPTASFGQLLRKYSTYTEKSHAAACKLSLVNFRGHVCCLSPVKAGHFLTCYYCMIRHLYSVEHFADQHL